MTRFWCFVGLSLLAALPAQAAQQWLVVEPAGQASVALASAGTGASELSGITYAGGNQFYVVGDNAAIVYPLTITFDPGSARINSASLDAGITLSTGHDLEGVAHNPDNASVYVSAETGPAVREHLLAGGSLLDTVDLPSVFSAHRSNLSLESLSREPGGAALWTANEEALSVDGPLASSAAGTTVRLQRFDGGLNANGQWAYVTDPIAGDIGGPGRDVEVSGVVDLVALPGGQLLVLERALGVGLFRNRIYEVDFTGATDVSAMAELSGASFTAVSKALLWEHFGFENFEGMSLGPSLANQARSLVLVSDDGSGLSQLLYALILLPNAGECAQQPLSGCREAVASTASVVSKHGTHDKLGWSWRRGSVADLSVFGDPTIGIGHGFALCVYDSVAAVPRLRISAVVGRGNGWRAAGKTGFRYSNRSGGAAGITKIKLRAGTGTAQVQVSGKGPALGMPAPPLTGNLLSRDPEITWQLVNRDLPGECFTASHSSARRESSEQFKSKF